MAANLAFGFGTPFYEQLEFFRKKLNLPTERWDDIKKSAHDKAFIVAGASKADLVNDLNSAMEKRIADGKGLEAFRREFRDIVKRHGWTGWTGEGTVAGEAWRTKVIYQTNMATSYAAGRWQQLNDPELLKLRPYWRYVHSDSVAHPRPHHLSWNGITLPYDHKFWQTHFAPNGWGCHCRIVPVSAEEYAKAQAAGRATPPAGWQDINPKTQTMVGIDRGFDYAPGANALRPMKDFIDAKLIKLDGPLGAAMAEALAPVLTMERQLAWFETIDAWWADKFPRGRMAIVGTLETGTLKWLAENNKPLPSSAEIAVADRLPLGAKQRRHEKDKDALNLIEWREVDSLLRKGDVYFDTGSGHLMFVGDGIGQTKITVEFDPIETKKADGLNQIISAFKVKDIDVYAMVKGRIWIPQGEVIKP